MRSIACPGLNWYFKFFSHYIINYFDFIWFLKSCLIFRVGNGWITIWDISSPKLLLETEAYAWVCTYTLMSILCDPMECSPPGSSVLEIIQARTLEWVAISYSRGSSWHKNQRHISSTSYIGRQVLYLCVTWEDL